MIIHHQALRFCQHFDFLTLFITLDNWYNHEVHPSCPDTYCAINVTLIHPCIQYTVQLSGIDVVGNEFHYDEKDITTDSQTPSEPLLLNTSEATTSSIMINWVSPSIGLFCVDHYKVCVTQRWANLFNIVY